MMPPSSSSYNMSRNNWPHSSSLSYGRHAPSSKQIADLVLLDATDIKWKLYGKNEHFSIMQEAVVKIQAFVRGCMSRAKTSEMIQELIDGILSYREVVTKYAAEDEARVKKQQLGFKTSEKEEEDETVLNQAKEISNTSPRRFSALTENKPWLHPDNKYTPSGTPIEVALKEQLNILDFEDIPWSEKMRSKMQECQNDGSSLPREPSNSNDKDGGYNHKAGALSSVPRSELVHVTLKERAKFWKGEGSPKSSGKSEQDQRNLNSSGLPKTASVAGENDTEIDVMFPEEYLEESVTVEPGGRGYHRYRTGAAGRNKRRPWRDDTNVFDAY
jgi:hypothetical protein